MKERLAKLLTVKSLVTLTITAVFVVLSLRGAMTAQEVLTVFSIIISFYFGTQYERRGGNNQ